MGVPPSISRIGATARRSIFSDAAAYADPDRWHAEAAGLRARGGLIRIEDAGHHPFWAAVRHDTVSTVGRKSAIFKNGPFPILTAGEDRGGSTPPVKNLVGMDDAEHQTYRGLIADWFNPHTLKRRTDEIRESARHYLAQMRKQGSAVDFATSVSVSLPLRFIASTLGIPEEDEERIHHWTRVVFGASDPEVAGGDYEAVMQRTVADMSAYFIDLATRWRARPDDSLGSVIANARVGGEFIHPELLVAYFVLLSLAGHDTVATVLAGGVEALARYPQQFAKLKAHPDLIGTAIEEMLRWVTPTKHFMRTAAQPCEVAGTRIAAGDWILLSYPSANRDETVFADPVVFDVGRREASRHLAFGIGPHFCVGQQLARLQLRIFFEEFLPMVGELSLDGEVKYTATTFVSTFKALPLRIAYSREVWRGRVNADD